ncbi:MAG: hypothetical protein K8M05_04960 [Deltaproteobacteria bacterium]|nr:hypothetical protein [Kofleriaceae bacterium]
MTLALGACAVEAADGAQGPLEGRRVLAAMQAGDVHFAAAHDGVAMPALAPAVTTGAVIVRASAERLVLEELELELADLFVTKQLGATTQVLHLTELRLRLGTQADAAAAWIDATQVSGAAPADLLLDWSLRASDGRVFPLATQRVRAALDVHLAAPGGGEAIASVTSTAPGLVWELGDITVSDLSLALVTAESGDMP